MKRMFLSSRISWRKLPTELTPGVTVGRCFLSRNAHSASALPVPLGIPTESLTTVRHFSSEPQSKSPTSEEAPVTESVDDGVPTVKSHPASALKFARERYTVPVTIRMPDISDTNDNKIEEWFKKPGDVIQRDDVLCDISTPDFTFGMSVDDETDAIMGDILIQAGEPVLDGTPICVVYHPEETQQKEEESKSKE